MSIQYHILSSLKLNAFSCQSQCQCISIVWHRHLLYLYVSIVNVLKTKYSFSIKEVSGMQFLRRYPECIDLSSMQYHCVTDRLCRGFDPGGMHPAVSGPGVSTSSPGRNASNLSTGAHILIKMGGSSRGSMRNLFIGTSSSGGILIGNSEGLQSWLWGVKL